MKAEREPKDIKNPKCAEFIPQKKKSRCIFQSLNGLTKMSQNLSRKGISSVIHYTIGGGQFDVTQRLGCMGCPLASRKKRIQFFKDNPRWLKAWIRAGQKWLTSEKYQNGKANFNTSRMLLRLWVICYIATIWKILRKRPIVCYSAILIGRNFCRRNLTLIWRIYRL